MLKKFVAAFSILLSVTVRADTSLGQVVPATDTHTEQIYPPPEGELDPVVPDVTIDDFYPETSRQHPMDLLFDGDMAIRELAASDVWKNQYAKLNAVSYDGGERVQNMLWRLRHGELDGQHPKLVVFDIGLYNLIDHDLPSDVVAGIQLCIAEVRKAAPDAHVVVMGLFPFLPSGNSDRVDRQSVQQTNVLLAKLDDKSHVTYLDINSTLVPPAGAAPDYFSNYPSNLFDIWAAALQPLIDQYLPSSSLTHPKDFKPIVSTEPILEWPLATTPPVGVPAPTFPVPIIQGLDHFLSDFNQLRHASYDVIFDGGDTGFGYDQQMQSEFGRIKGITLSHGPDTAGNIQWRVQHNELKNQNPKLIVLSPLLRWTGAPTDAPKAADADARLVAACELVCPNAHIALVGPIAKGNDSRQARKFIDAVNEALAKTLAADQRVTLVTVMSSSDADGEPNSGFPNNPGNLADASRQAWADAVRSQVEQYVPGAK